MDVKAFPALIVGVVVALVLAGAVLPVFAETTSAETTFKNEGYYYMEKYPAGTELTVSWDYTKPTTLTVNGVDIALPDNTNMSTIPYTIFCCDTWYLRYGYDTAYYAGIYQNASNTSYTGYVPDSRSLSITVTDAGVTTVDNGTAHTWSNATGDFYIISDSGDYVMKKTDKDAYVLADSPIFGYGRTYARSYNYTSELIGNVDNGITGAYYPETTISTTGWTFSDVTLNSVKQTAYNDLYTVSTMTYEITGENIQPYTAVFSQYIVPSEVTAEKVAHPDGPLTVMLNVLPLLAIAGLVTGAVVWFINRKG